MVSSLSSTKPSCGRAATVKSRHHKTSSSKGKHSERGSKYRQDASGKSIRKDKSKQSANSRSGGLSPKEQKEQAEPMDTSMDLPLLPTSPLVSDPKLEHSQENNSSKTSRRARLHALNLKYKQDAPGETVRKDGDRHHSRRSTKRHNKLRSRNDRSKPKKKASHKLARRDQSTKYWSYYSGCLSPEEQKEQAELIYTSMNLALLSTSQPVPAPKLKRSRWNRLSETNHRGSNAQQALDFNKSDSSGQKHHYVPSPTRSMSPAVMQMTKYAGSTKSLHPNTVKAAAQLVKDEHSLLATQKPVEVKYADENVCGRKKPAISAYLEHGTTVLAKKIYSSQGESVKKMALSYIPSPLEIS